MLANNVQPKPPASLCPFELLPSCVTIDFSHQVNTDSNNLYTIR
jgi:hypothetical protein